MQKEKTEKHLNIFWSFDIYIVIEKTVAMTVLKKKSF